MKIRTRFFLATGAIAALLGLLLGIFLITEGLARSHSAKLASYSDERAAVKDLELQTLRIWQFYTSASLARSGTTVGHEGRAALDGAIKDIDTLLSFETAETIRKPIEDLEGIIQGFWDAGAAMVAAYGNNKATGDAALRDFDAAGQKMLGFLGSLVDPMLAGQKAAEKDYEAGLRLYFTLALSLCVVALALAAAVGMALSARLSRPLKAAASSLRALASRTSDLTARLDSGLEGEAGELARSFNAFAETLGAIMVNIAALVEKNRMLGEHLSTASRVSAESVADMNDRIGTMRDGIGKLDRNIIGSSIFIEEIMASINNLTAQVESQFRAIERSSASIEEIMASIGNVARIAESRTAGMKGLADLIGDGGRKVAATKAVILEISKSAYEMLGMVDIINSIASRTNLLAMNASIEAAHAGAAGKGFAVVAGEIRNLATTTATNASAIAKSLTATNEKVAEATASGEESERAFEVINREVATFSDALGEVTVSMQELSQASTEILDSINTLVETSGTVKAASIDMRDGTSEILQSMHEIKEVSASTLSSTEELAGFAATLSSVSLKVAAFGNQNLYNSSMLAAEVAKLDAGEKLAVLESASIDYGIGWSDVLSVGVLEMDDQHKELFRRISALLQGMLGGTGAGKVHDLLAFIDDYITRHFSDEERLMRERGFPGLDEHRLLHVAFKDEFGGIAGRIRTEGLNASLLIQLQDRVINWLIDHIGKVDKRYGEFMNGEGRSVG